MKIRRTKSLLSILIVVVCIASCKKDIDKFIPDQVNLFGDLSDISAAFGNPLSQNNFDVNSDFPIRVETQKGTIVETSSSSFQFKDGTPCNGNIRIEVTDLLSKGEILMYGIPTISNGEILESGGEFIIKAYQGDKELELIPGKKINLKVPNENPIEEMELFYGQRGQDGSLANGSWIEADNDPSTTSNVWESAWEDSIRVGFGYECFSDSMNFVNIDYFTKFDLDLTQVCVDLPNGYDTENTTVFGVFQDYNIVIALTGNPDLEMFCAQLPIGESIQFVVLAAEEEDKFHFGNISSTITENLFVEIIPEETPIDDIKAFLMSL